MTDPRAEFVYTLVIFCCWCFVLSFSLGLALAHWVAS